MGQLTDPQFWVAWIQIVIIDLTLAGDNALVIALAVRNLPPRQQWQGRIWGTFGAVALRVLFIFVVTFLLRIPFLQAAGGGLLIWIALKLLTQESGAGHENVRHGTTLLEAIWIIVVADVIMSLDNVLAVAGAAHGDFLLVVLGVGLSIPIVIWGSGLLARLMARYPWIVEVGAGVLGWVAGRMIVDDRIVRGFIWSHDAKVLDWLVQAVLAVGVIVVGRWWMARRRAMDAAGASAPHR